MLPIVRTDLLSQIERRSRAGLGRHVTRYQARIGSAALGVAMLALMTESACAQEDPPDKTYATGAVMVAEKVTSAFSRPVTFRNFLPSSVDISPRLPPPGDQGGQGSCVGWAVGYAARAYYVGVSEGRSLTDGANIPSPAYIYGRALKREGTSDCDAGMRIFEALDDLKDGALSLSVLPYDERVCPHPTAAQGAAVLDFKIESWKFIRATELDTIKGELSAGHPLVFDLALSKSFHKYRGSGVFRRGRDPLTGGRHAMVLVGYDEARQAFRLQNSWGPGWGDRGRGWLSYETFRLDAGGAYSLRPVLRANPPPVLVQPAPPPTPQPLPIAETRDVTDDIGVACAKVQFTARDGEATLHGFVASAADLEKVKTSRFAVEAKISVVVRAWPQCEVLLTLDPWLAGNDAVSIAIAGGASGLTAGQGMPIDVVSPAWASYINVAYIQADGSVIHLVQTDPSNLRTVAPRSHLTFGNGARGGSIFRASPPFGDEIALVVASSSPLFGETRPNNETEREFLTALRRALLWRPDPVSPGRRIVASVAAVTTRDK